MAERSVQKRIRGRDVKRGKLLYVMISIPILWYIIFCYLPMAGIVIAFKDYNMYQGVVASPWVAFKHFQRFLTDSYFWQVFKNTFTLGFFNTLICFPAPIILALIFNEIRDGKFKRVSQTVSYLPHFVSTVALVNILVVMLSPSTGIVNAMLRTFGVDPVNFLVEPQWFRPLYILLNLWRESGWGTIIYLAAMTNIDPELYKVADIDGAGRLRKIWNITIPAIMPTIAIMLMLALPGIIGSDFETVLLLQQPITYSTSDVIGTFVYRRGLIDSQFDFATAIGLVFSTFSMVIIYISNKLGRKIGGISLW